MTEKSTNSSRIIMCKGLPASGKSTWAKEYVLNGNGAVKRVSKDDLRGMIDSGKHSYRREDEILAIRNMLTRYWLAQGYTVVIDDTNFAEKHETVLREIAREFEAEFQIKDFTHVPMTTCLERNRTRDNAVPDKVIYDMWKKSIYVEPAWVEEGEYAVICDLDGTLCLLNGRSPYDASTCINDDVNGLVLDLIRYYENDCKIIFFSGRDSKYRQQTLEWLYRYYGSEPELYMRAEGDTRADQIIKREMYEKHIQGKYNVWAVIDDRPKVIRMWKYDLCLPVIDVGEGIEF